MDHAIELLVENVAQNCREAYIFERQNWEAKRATATGKSGRRRRYNPGPRWDGGEDARGHNYKPIWPKIAQFALANQLDPWKMMSIRFGLSHGTYPPFPNQIALPTYLEDYLNGHTPLTAEMVKLEKDSEIERCTSEIMLALDDMPENGNKQTEWRSVLYNELLPFSPLLRYCIAYSEGFTDIAKYFEVAAMTQYSQAPDLYKQVWGDLLPVTLDEVEHAFGSAKIGRCNDD